MNREPCRVSDDPYYDYSDYIEQRGVYSTRKEDDSDDAYNEWRLNNPRKEPAPAAGSLDPLITPHVGDKDA